MSDTADHAAHLRKLADIIGAEFDGSLSDQIEDHTDALAAQLAEAEARAERLRELCRAAEARSDDNPRSVQRYLYARAQCGGHGDLAPADSEGQP